MANGYVYVIGGDDGSGTQTSTILYAKLNSDGSTGTWSTNTSALPAVRDEQTSVVANGYVYVIGGSNGTQQSTVFYASTSRVQIGASLDLVGLGGSNLADAGGTGGSLVASDGTFIGNFQVQGQANFAQGVGVYGTLSVAGSSTFQNNTNSTNAFQVQNSTGSSLVNVDTSNSAITLLGNNDGQLAAWATNANVLPGPRNTQASVTANGYVYAIGGIDNAGTPQSTVYYAKLNADGSTAVWSTNTNALPAARFQSSAVVANGYVYVIAGRDGSSVASSTVYYAKLNADGSTGTWTTSANALTAARYIQTAAVANGYVYVVGGLSSGAAAQSTVYYAKLNADGSTSTWTTNANALPAIRYGQSTVVANGYIYAIAGNDGSGAQSTVYYAKLNADGSTAAWSTNANALTATRYDLTSVVSNGFVYASGGYSGGVAQSTVYYAKLNSDGSTSTWSTNTNALTGIRGDHSSVVANGYVYVIGGYNGTSGQTTVYYASTSRLKIGGNLDLVGLQGQNLGDDGGGGGVGSTGGSITAGNITAVGALQVQGQGAFAQGISIGGNITVGGSALFQNSANSTVAFQVQDAGGVSLLAVDTFSRIITISGDATTFGNLTLNNAHFKSSQTTAPTIGTPTNCGTTPSAAVATNSTDSAGSIRITAGTGSPTTCDTVFSFNKTYGSAPKSIIVMAETQDGGTGTASARQIYVSATATGTFTIKMGSAPAASEVNWFYYWVVE